MNEQFLESAEFYQKRYHNFASCLIVAKSYFTSISSWFFHAG